MTVSPRQDSPSYPRPDSPSGRNAESSSKADHNAKSPVREVGNSEGINLFVSRLSYKTLDADLRDAFSKYGEVKSCVIVRDTLGDSRGFAFVHFVNENEGMAAIDKMTDTEFDGRRICVERAKRNRPRTPTPGQRYQGPGLTAMDSRRRDRSRDRYDDRRSYRDRSVDRYSRGRDRSGDRYGRSRDRSRGRSDYSRRDDRDYDRGSRDHGRYDDRYERRGGSYRDEPLSRGRSPRRDRSPY
eukprot:Partr_v1_DN24566_c0_g2_i1_m19750 putative RNA recognition motif. (a.k.a. RRM, RBD, or RNP domain)